MKKNLKKSLSLLLALLMCLSLCACGSGAAKASQSYTSAAGAAHESPMAAAAPMEAMEMAWEDGDYGVAVSNSSAADEVRGEEGSAPEESPDKIIYSSDVNVETTDFEGTLANLEEMIRQYGGWIQSSSISGADFYNQSRGNRSARSANYVLRIPSAKFDAMMNGLSALGNVPYSHTYTENVTAQYYDVQARLTAYKTQEARLLEMMEVAETVEDIILLEDRLTELRYEIESLQSTLNNWDRRVSYSTINLNISEVWEYTPEPEQKISYGRELWLALLDGVRGVGDFFSDLLLFLVGALPVLLVLGVLAAIIVPLVKKGRARRQAKKEAKRAAMLESVKAKDAENKQE